MDVRRDSFVIAINGASGAGKSTLVKALVQELGDAVSVYFDDYDPRNVASSKYPAEFQRTSRRKLASYHAIFKKLPSPFFTGIVYCSKSAGEKKL